MHGRALRHSDTAQRTGPLPTAGERIPRSANTTFLSFNRFPLDLRRRYHFVAGAVLAAAEAEIKHTKHRCHFV